MEQQRSINDQFLATINKIIEDNLDNENFSVEDLADKVALSRSMLHRKLIKLTGKSATDLITEKRITVAKALLENDVATVSEIAYRVGFNSPSYFSKVFQKHFGYPPGQFRKNAAEDPSLQGSDVIQNSKRLRRIKLIKVLLFSAVAGIMLFVGYYFFVKAEPAEKSVAVLPLHNLTGEDGNAYFSEGLQDALIGELGKIGSIRVISRTSTLRYRDTKMLLKDIARELGVNTIVEGSVLRAGDSLRVLIQLIEVFPKERHILSRDYYEEMRKVLVVQSAAAKEIVEKIGVKLSKTEEQHFAKSKTVDPETYKAYLRGMYNLNKGTKESYEAGLKYLQEAVERDPGDPFAYAGLALGYAINTHGQQTAEEKFVNASNAANKALKIDSTLDEVHTTLALLRLYDKWDWSAARESFERAIANNPNNEIAHAHFAWYHVLFGDNEKAIYHAHRAAVIEPFSASYHSWLAWLYFHDGDYDNAELWARKSLVLNPDLPYGNIVLSWALIEKKQYQKALELYKKLPENPYMKMFHGYAYIRAGQKEKAIALWNELEETSKKEYINPCYRGIMAAYLGFTDKSFALLNEAFNKRVYPIAYIGVYPGSEIIKDDPRYRALIQKMNLPVSGTFLASNR